MKTMIVYRKQIQYIFLYLLLPASLFLLPQPAVYAGATPHMLNKVQSNNTIVITKTTVSKKYKIKLYTGATQEVVFFSASGESGKVYQLFVFDMDGKLVKQTQIHNRETTLLTNFEKGSYLFQVFSDDEQIENGTMMVR